MHNASLRAAVEQDAGGGEFGEAFLPSSKLNQ
jgi:hypothetical protein